MRAQHQYRDLAARQVRHPASNAPATNRARIHARPVLSALAAAALLAACGGGGDGGWTPPAIEIRTLSNRADLVSGGDAMVEILLPANAQASGLTVQVGGRDVSSAFARRADGRITGLVSGLAVGTNVLVAQAPNASAAELSITNASRGGPLISGAQITPFFCATPTPQGATSTSPATNASGLATAATDAQCNIAAEYKLYYRTTAAGCTTGLPDPSPSVAFGNTAPATTATPPANGCFKPYDPSAAAPADMATTTTDAGRSVPFIVRVERGTMNRGIYDIAVLVDPTQPWTDGTQTQAAWNGKVYYQFGASTGQTRRQFRPATAWTGASSQLGLGFMVVANSMSDSGINSNRVLTAETVMMMKEHIVDRYGPIKYTMGTGGSGGAINSNTNASIAPGQLDGVVILATYPDAETTSIEVTDCVQLVEAYQKPVWTALMTGAGYTQDQINAKKAAINGHLDPSACHGWFNAFGSNSQPGNFAPRYVLNHLTGAIVTPSPATTNNCELPAGLVWSASNPGGARCGGWDWSASVFGKTADGVRARDTRDNVGVQYGLKALQSGAITAEEFVTLNELAGGSDADSQPQTARTVADASALATAYRSGVVLDGRQLAKTAVIDLRGWDDSSMVTQPGTSSPPTTAIHFMWRSFAVRERLDKDYGDHGSQAVWRFGRGGLSSATLIPQAFVGMDTWLTALKADTGSGSVADKVRRTRPANTADFCLLSTDTAQSTRVTDAATCDADPFLKPTTSPRQVAGGPLAENILKCTLKPLDTADYGGKLDAAQLARLGAVFAGGVCDWSKPGVAQQAAAGPLDFRTGPGGQVLGTAPVSKMR